MKINTRRAAWWVVLAAMPLGLVSGNAAAVEKSAKEATAKVVSTVVAENDRFKVIENRFAPGAVNEAPPTASPRVVRALKGGTLMRTFADGKTEKVEWKTGETRILDPSTQPYTNQNVGKSELVLFVVALKK